MPLVSRIPGVSINRRRSADDLQLRRNLYQIGKLLCLLPYLCEFVLRDSDNMCSEDDACGPLFVYESAPEENLLGTQLVCRLPRFGDTPWTAYRHFPDVTATATHSTKTDASPASTTSLPEQTSTSTTTSTATPTSSPNKAMIAGVVVGIIVAIALVGALGFFIARRKFRSKPVPPKNEDGAPANPFASPEDKQWEGQGMEMNHFGPAELHNTDRPVELGHYGHSVVEMPVHNDRRFVAELDGSPVGRR
ncbi:hypothetical protein FQN50_009793 [Emmonsiellopsis sp. PD_5]|nr:hypothetical protein FQN50_009793 [Emmonsiellopsis sp. PD_5]